MLFILDKPERVHIFASDTTVCSGTNVFFNCSAAGNPPVLIYQLYENNVAVNNVSSSGMWSRTMSTRGVFNYRCVASNAIGTATSARVTITVNGRELLFWSENKCSVLSKSGEFPFIINCNAIPGI